MHAQRTMTFKSSQTKAAPLDAESGTASPSSAGPATAEHSVDFKGLWQAAATKVTQEAPAHHTLLRIHRDTVRHPPPPQAPRLPRARADGKTEHTCGQTSTRPLVPHGCPPPARPTDFLCAHDQEPDDGLLHVEAWHEGAWSRPVLRGR